MDANKVSCNVGKIVELDDESLSDEASDFENEDEVPLKFKQSVLKNKSAFEKKLLESTEINPSEIFEVQSCQEVEGETKKLYAEMEQQILECLNCEEDDEDKLLKMSQRMTPLPGGVGVFKNLVQAGEGSCPPVDSIVTIHYNGYIQDEISNQVKSFDSTFLRGKPKTFMRGTGLVIEGLDLAVGSMKQKEQAEFIISPDLAWGERGCPPRIPANAYVYFKVDLVDWVDSSAAEAFNKLPISMRKELSFQQVLEAAKSEKRKGTAYFEKQNYNMALKCYRRSLGWIGERTYANEEEENLAQNLCLTLHLDLAFVYLRLNKPKKTCIHCKDALELDPENPKAFYRFGLAQEKLGDFDAARRSFLKAKQICPKDPSIAKALIALNEKVKRERFIETDLCRRMLGSALTSQKSTVSLDESHKIILNMLKEFVANSNDKQLKFPQGMTEGEIAFIEEEACRMNLKFALKPTANGNDICMVSKD